MNHIKSWALHIVCVGITLLLLLSLCACDGNATQPSIQTPAPLEYVCEENIYLRLNEPYANTLLDSGKNYSVSIDGITYFFWEDITQPQRDAFIETERAIISCLEDKGIIKAGLKLYVLSDYKNRSDSENAEAFYGVSRTGTYEQVLTTLQTIWGDYTNYGYLYALSNAIAAELDFVVDSATATDDASAVFFKDHSEYLALVYPCFDAAYSPEEAIRCCKALTQEALLLSSVDLSKPIEHQEQAFFDSIAIYAKQNAIDYVAKPYVFAYNGSGCPLKFRTDYFECFITAGYKDLFNEQAGISDMMKDYSILLETVKIMYDEVEKLRSTLNCQPEFVIPIEFISGEQATINGASCYTGTAPKHIELVSLISFLHEYAHFLYDELGALSNESIRWKNEAFACYFGSQSYLNTRFYYNLYVNIYPDSDTAAEFEHYVGRKFREQDDVQYMYDILCYKENKFGLGDHTQLNSLALYIADTYGENTFIKTMIDSNDVVMLTGKTMDKIIEDWQAYIIRTYSVVDAAASE